MSDAIRNVQVKNEIQDQAKLLWTSLDSPDVPKWEHDEHYRFYIYHCPNKDLIRVKVFHKGKVIVDTKDVFDKDDGKSLKGGQLGVFVDSQENVKWENIFYRYCH